FCEVAIRDQTRGYSFCLHALDGATEKRDAFDLNLQSDTVGQRHLARVSRQTKSSHIRHGVNTQPGFADCESSIPVQRGHALDRRIDPLLLGYPALDGGGDDAGSNRLGEKKSIARLCSLVLEHAIRMNRAGDRVPEFHL